jgi:hypothetical protein
MCVAQERLLKLGNGYLGSGTVLEAREWKVSKSVLQPLQDPGQSRKERKTVNKIYKELGVAKCDRGEVW